MRCGCGNLSVSNSPAVNEYMPLPHKPCVEINCTYTLEQLIGWKDRLNCIKSTLVGQDASINRYLGTVISAINYPTNLCYFYNELILIEDALLDLPQC